MIYIDNKESNSLRLIFTLNIALVAYVIVPERSKGTDLRSVVHKHARVRTPPMTSVYIAIFFKYNITIVNKNLEINMFLIIKKMIRIIYN